MLSVNDLPPEIRWAKAPVEDHGCPFELPEDGIDLEAVERGLVLQAFERTKHNQPAAAGLLGISRCALRYRLEKYGLL